MIADRKECLLQGLVWESDSRYGNFDDKLHAFVMIISALTSCYTPILDMLSDAPVAACRPSTPRP